MRDAGERNTLAEKQRSEEHTSELHHSQISYAVFCLKKNTSELQSQSNLVCRLLLEKKKMLLSIHFSYLLSNRYHMTISISIHVLSEQLYYRTSHVISY